MQRTRLTTTLAAAALLASLLLAPGCTRSQGSTKAFCAQVQKVPALEAVLSRFSEADPDVLNGRIDKARDAYAQLADAAPSAIRRETAEVVSLVDDILAAVEKNPTDPAKAANQLRRAMAKHPKADADRAKVAAYAQSKCHVQLDPTITQSNPTNTTAASDPSITTTTTAAGG